MKGIKGFTKESASLAGVKSAETRRKNKTYREQFKSVFLSQAEQAVADFMDNKAVFGITIAAETRAKIVEQVITEVTAASLINAIKHQSDVDLICLKHDLSLNDEPAIDGEIEQPALLTNADIMRMVGTSYEQRDEKPESQQTDDILFYEWYNKQSPKRKQCILDDYFNSDADELMNYSGRSAESVISKLGILCTKSL